MKFRDISDSESTSCSEKQFERLLRLAAILQAPDSGEADPVAQGEDSSGRYQSNTASEEIARRAFQLYLQRGGSHGWDMADWLQAEEELRQKQGREKNMRRLALSWGLLKNPSEGTSSHQ